MKIKELVIKHEEKKGEDLKVVKFNDDVSILTGKSKKGKSAVLEIVDFCLFSSSNIIPQGVVSEKSKFFALSLIAKEYIVILYRNAKTLKMKMDLIPNDEKVELTYNFDDITADKSFVQSEFENIIGINISAEDVSKYSINKSRPEKYSIRYQVPYHLLAQNIIANKDVLFRNFSESRYRLNMREQFKFLFGLETIEDYIRGQKIKKLKTKKKKIETLYKSTKEDEEVLLDKINLFLSSYNIKKIKNIEEFLQVDKLLTESESDKEGSYRKILNKIKEEQLYLDKLQRANSNDRYLIEQLNNNKIIESEINNSKYDVTCPICKSHDTTYGEFIKELNYSQTQYNKFVNSNYSLTKDLEKSILTVSEEIKSKQDYIRNLNEQKSNYIKNKNNGFDSQEFFKQYYELKQEVDIFSIVDSEKMNEVNNELDKLIRNHRKNETAIFEKRLNENLTEIIKLFDIEESYHDMELAFDIKTFDYYFKQKESKKKISLSNTGSGANWLSMHLTLNIALLKTIKDMNLNSTLFNFLILDQPTQVYFSTDDEYNELSTIADMFITLFDISKEIGVQIIILEHIRTNAFEGIEDKNFQNEFDQHTIENWHDSIGLLPFESIKEKNEKITFRE